MSADRFSTFDERSERRDRVQHRATKSDIRHLKRQAAGADSLAQSAYEEGLKEGKRNATAKTKAPKTHVTKAARATKRAAAQPIKAGARQGVREVQIPVQSQVAGGIRTLTLVAAVVALYVFLESVPTVTGALGGITSGLNWLKSPTSSIKYHGS